MSEFKEAFLVAVNLIAFMDQGLVEIILLSLQVTLTSVFLAVVVGMPLGGLLAVKRFPLQRAIQGLFHALMGLPPVVVGLVIYLLLSRSGPLGILNLLFTPAAMIIAQLILVFPIVVSLTCQLVQDYHDYYDEQLRSWGCGVLKSIKTLLWEARFSLLTIVLAGFGRAIGEVGAVLIVGGNINHATRVMTTSIVLETSKGNLALALALGILLLILALAVTFLLEVLKRGQLK